ncbi:hypothetical protein [Azospirillum palustre]
MGPASGSSASRVICFCRRSTGRLIDRAAAAAAPQPAGRAGDGRPDDQDTCQQLTDARGLVPEGLIQLPCGFHERAGITVHRDQQLVETAQPLGGAAQAVPPVADGRQHLVLQQRRHGKAAHRLQQGAGIGDDAVGLLRVTHRHRVGGPPAETQGDDGDVLRLLLGVVGLDGVGDQLHHLVLDRGVTGGLHHQDAGGQRLDGGGRVRPGALGSFERLLGRGGTGLDPVKPVQRHTQGRQHGGQEGHVGLAVQRSGQHQRPHHRQRADDLLGQHPLAQGTADGRPLGIVSPQPRCRLHSRLEAAQCRVTFGLGRTQFGDGGLQPVHRGGIAGGRLLRRIAIDQRVGPIQG